MRLLRIVGKSASSHTTAAATTALSDNPDGAGAVTVIAAGVDRNNDTVNGTRVSVCYQQSHLLLLQSSSLINEAICVHNATVFMIVCHCIHFIPSFVYKKNQFDYPVYRNTHNYTSGWGLLWIDAKKEEEAMNQINYVILAPGHAQDSSVLVSPACFAAA